jgi:hypothetical protein
MPDGLSDPVKKNSSWFQFLERADYIDIHIEYMGCGGSSSKKTTMQLANE